MVFTVAPQLGGGPGQGRLPAHDAGAAANREGDAIVSTKGNRARARALGGLLLSTVLWSAAATAVIPTQQRFIENAGQWDKAARFRMMAGQTDDGPARRVDLWLTDQGYVYQLIDLSRVAARAAASPAAPEARIRQHAVAVRFIGARPPQIDARAPVAGDYHWLDGFAARRPAATAKAFGQVVYRDTYPGIDVVFDASTAKRVMETTYVVAPGAAPSAIALRFDGADAMRVDAEGNLVLATSLGDITELRPYAFQKDATGDAEPVPVAFALKGRTLRFEVGRYDHGRTLYIDPVVVFSRTFGGTGTDAVSAMHEDATGRYVTGVTSSTDFPATVGATSLAGTRDLFAAKFSLDQQTLLWATYVGSDQDEYGGNSALDTDGSLYLVGHTDNGGTFAPDPPTYTYGAGGGFDIAIAHLIPNGTGFFASAVLGGTSADYAANIGLDDGYVYVVGATNGVASFPAGSGGGYQTTANGAQDAFVVRLNAALSSHLNTTIVPGGASNEAANSVAFDATHSVYVMGTTLNDGSYPATTTIGPAGNYDVFVAKFDAALTTQSYNALIGGTSTDGTPGISYTSFPNYLYNTAYNGLVVDASNRAWVATTAASSDFPVTPGAYRTTNAGNYDVVVFALNPSGTALDRATYLGGSSTDVGRAIAFDTAGNVYVAGASASSDYPVSVPGGFAFAGGYDMVVSVFTPDLAGLVHSTCWGGSSTDFASSIVVGPVYAARLAGAGSPGFPLVPGGGPTFGTGGGYDGAVVSMTGLVSAVLASVPVPATSPTSLGALLLALAGLAFATMRRRRGSGR